MRGNTLFKLLSLLVLAGLVLAACGGTSPTADNPYAEIPFEEGISVSADSCDYGGKISSIEATDRLTVVFNLCKPDPAFLAKVAFTPFGIQPREYLDYAGPSKLILEAPVGTGPYRVAEWVRGDHVTFTAFENYWGTPAVAATAVLRWATEGSARLVELQAGTADMVTNISPADIATVQADPNLNLIFNVNPNVFYLAFTNTFAPWDNVDVRRAVSLGLDRSRIVENYYPAGSEVASHFTPCAIPNGCVGDAWYDFDPEAARALLAEAGFPDGFATKIYYRDVVRGYLPQVPNVAQDVQAQLLENLNIEAEIVVMESGAFIEESSAGRLDGLYFLGWGADYPHVTNFLDFHFGEANGQFGTPHPEIFENLVSGSQIADPAESEPYYVAANNAIRELVPMVAVAHGGSGTAYRADVTNAQASPLTNEQFAVSDPGGRDVFVFMQNAEPISLFCADETDGESLRACDQVIEALYGYEVNGTAVVPMLAEVCEPNDDLSVWTCTLRQGVTFHDGSTFDANDVVATFTMGLDASSPLHQGNTGIFEYYDYLWGLMNKPAE